VTNRTIELLILFIVALYVVQFIMPKLFAALGGLVHLLLVVILILIIARLLQGNSSIR
jgi:hypothetical protein